MRRAVRFLALAAVVFVAAVALRSRWLPEVARWLDVGRPIQAADYVMVLPGGETTRPLVAAAMVRRGLSSKVLVPTTVQSPQVADGIAPENHELLSRVLAARGVGHEQIEFLTVASGSTWNDAQALSDFLATRPDATIALVTSDYHTRRARWVVRRVLGARAAQVAMISAPTDLLQPDRWWHSEQGLRTYGAEYTKLLVYYARYGDPKFWSLVIVGFLAVLFIFRPRRETKMALQKQDARCEMRVAQSKGLNQLSPTNKAPCR